MTKPIIDEVVRVLVTSKVDQAKQNNWNITVTDYECFSNFIHRLAGNSVFCQMMLVFNSAELKTQVSLSDNKLSIVCLSVNCKQFRSLLQNRWAIEFWVKGIHFFLYEEPQLTFFRRR